MQSWKNGQGETREVAREPESGDFDWRVSLAGLKEENEFSTYPGYERWIAFMGDFPVRLSFAESGRERIVPTLTPVRFGGDLQIKCYARPNTRDFNVIVSNGWGRATLHAMRYGKSEQVQFPLNGREHFLYVVTGRLQTDDRNSGAETQLGTDQTLRISRQTKKECLALRTHGLEDENFVFWVTLHKN